MPKPVILLSVPALREKDVAAMPKLRELMAGGGIAELTPGFPCVTCPVQANMTTGKGPAEHGVVANGFYHRDKRRVEMWTAPNDFLEQPQIWNLLAHHGRGPSCAVWFPLHGKGCEADYVCTPAPIHNPDGSESLWCYSRPTELYGELRDALGHFPLKNYWGPLAGAPSSEWIVDSALFAARRWQPDFFYIYLQHLDYVAQRSGPNGPAAEQAVAEFDGLVQRLAEGMQDAYREQPLWIVAGEYAITPVEHVGYPNRVLRDAGLLAVREEDDGEHLDFEKSRAFAMVDHQFSHVFVADGDERLAERVAELFRNQPGIAEALVGTQRGRYGLEHPRSGEVILISTPQSWQAYYWWLSDARAPKFARTVDIHRKPGYDPVELCFDTATKSIPLDATLIKGSHGAPAVDPSQRSVLLASDPTLFPGPGVTDTGVFDIVLKHFGLQ
ncbi:MAG: alkaline phosphatase family protein [Planctomycetes bacterium]|nr:alkaline phosphatase family protein [Planctomycetota bacterium]MBU4399363.1 alkaline phosphatase family protein [Planctomycetota bacterium]